MCLNIEWTLRRMFLAENYMASFYYSSSLHRNLKPTDTMLLMASARNSFIFYFMFWYNLLWVKHVPSSSVTRPY